MCFTAYGQNLPSGYIGTVNETSTYVYQNFSYTWTAPTTTVDYFGLAFRQDPGYWSVGNFNLTAAGSSTNLLANPNLQYGGTVSSYGMAAPADWGVWYQSSAGAPPAAGFWSAPGQGWYGSYTGGLGVNTSTAGSWIDGAVGTYDGIYQGFSATAGTTYTFSFTSLGTNSYSNPSIMIGIYAGACASGSSIFNCTPNSSSGFTAAMTPQATQSTGGAPPPPDPTGPTVISTTNTVITTTTTSGSTVYTYSQPVTITTYSDNSTTTTNNGSATLISATTTGTSGGITTSQQNDVNGFNSATINNNGIYIRQSGNNDVINIQQIGAHNLIGGINTQFASIQNGNNNITIKQGNGRSGKNEIDMSITGGSNIASLNQAYDLASVSAGNNYQLINVSGFSNNITTSQTNDGGSAGHFLEAVINGNYNTVGIVQSNDVQKQMFASITGNSNTLNTTQSGSGAHYLSVNMSGNGNSATVNQNNSGSSGANSAQITLTNSGAPASVNLTQTGGQSYSISQTCYTTCGTVTVRQGN
jgi:hypothetical protein